MVYEGEKNSTNGAEWTIFRREDTSKLREYLRESRQHTTGDPILSTEYFLDRVDFEALEKWNVHPFRFVQHAGEAVFINVGCAHQVRSAIVCLFLYVLTALVAGQEPERLHQDGQ